MWNDLIVGVFLYSVESDGMLYSVLLLSMMNGLLGLRWGVVVWIVLVVLCCFDWMVNLMGMFLCLLLK